VKVDVLEPAVAELREAVEYYNQQSEGLGFEFAAEVKRTIARIVQFPDAWPALSVRTRRCRTNRFPYGIVYHVREDEILVVAVMHLRRHPETWRSRLKSARE
jgi:plasmid stabilization system protein ParE